MKRILALIFVAFALSLTMGAACPTGKPPQVSNTGLGEGREIYQTAEDFFEQGNYEAAIQTYQEVLDKYPGSGYADKSLFRLGQCYYKTGDSDKALEQFKKYVDQHRDDSQLTVAQDYVISITEKKYQDLARDYEKNINGLESQNFRMEMLNRYLRRSVEAETVYIEIDRDATRLYVKLGSQTLYDYPVVVGKGKTWVQDFSTPKGIRQVESIIPKPKWYRPNWYWKEKGLEVPEDITMEERAVEGALGPFKIVLGEGYAIHGTRAGKIRPGKLSHGCIRMNNAELKQLVKMIEVGTLVYIY